MSFEVDVHPRALADLENIHDFLNAYSTDAADLTYALIKNGILSLSDFPRRFAIAPESAKASIELRQLIVGNYRILYSIIGKRVHIWRVLHSAQEPLSPMDLF